MEIFIHRNGQDSGPYSPREVLDRLDQGHLDPTDYGWHEGAPEWLPLHKLEAVNTASLLVLPPMPVARKARSGVTSIQRICPYCSEPIQTTALKCRHCGEMLDGDFRKRQHSDLGTVTIQRTSKPLKAQMLFCQLALLGSIVGFFVGAAAQFPPLATLGGLGFLASLLGVFVMRFRIWWHHG